METIHDEQKRHMFVCSYHESFGNFAFFGRGQGTRSVTLVFYNMSTILLALSASFRHDVVVVVGGGGVVSVRWWWWSTTNQSTVGGGVPNKQTNEKESKFKKMNGG